ncbi:hypothetical protein D6C84_10303 [Aureobasidium pullulans]|uniref:F-box domain-containing protein n=1 Tax=Aureobasidium pullulans TaxID=5580 RepID=A0A4S9WZA3_AURPU|nr:hypothetical protein D6C84_10303 [Aureobasidium pullulans]
MKTIKTRSQTKKLAQELATALARPVQTCTLLTVLPLEMRYMIFEHIFAEEAKPKLPHPLMQTCKQLEEEATDAAARILGTKVHFTLKLNNTRRTSWSIRHTFRFQWVDEFVNDLRASWIKLRAEAKGKNLRVGD